MVEKISGIIAASARPTLITGEVPKPRRITEPNPMPHESHEIEAPPIDSQAIKGTKLNVTG